MKTLHYIITVGFVTGLLVMGTTSAFASVELHTYMPIDGHPITPIFKFSKTILIDYPSGSTLQKELSGRTFTVEFSDDSDKNPTIRSFMQQLNADIANERRSSSSVTNLSIQYETIIHGDDKQATFDYLVTLQPTLVTYVLNAGNTDTPTVLDVSWMGFVIRDPVVIATSQYGNLEINSPLGVIQNQLPVIYEVLKGISQENVLKTNLIDASPLVGDPIDQWNTIFDPMYTLDDTAGHEYAGQKAAVTAFAYGPTDLYQVYIKPKINSMNFTADSKYHITTIDKPSSATLDVQGHATGYPIQGEPAISTLILTSGNKFWSYAGNDVIGLSNIALYAITGSIVLIIGVIFWWNYKKRKK
ncbi:MAG: hypothetical protein LV477_01690 [Candidatus Nitrosotalea sp.]|nr:hypothetical protein [Candidatus Nitrosotalea sp.]